MSQTQEEIDADLDAAAAKPSLAQVDGQQVQHVVPDPLKLAKFRQNQRAAGGNAWVQTVRARFVPDAATGPNSRDG